MLTPPPELESRFGLASGAKERALPRFWLVYKGPHKSKLLSTVWAMTMAGALPDHHQDLKWKRKVYQTDLARMAGSFARETFTRRLRHFSNAYDWLPRPYAPGPRLIFRRRRFHDPNRYYLSHDIASSSRMIQANQKGTPGAQAPAGCYIPPSPAELAAHETWGHLWDGSAQMTGYDKVPRWVWDPKFPLTEKSRLVFTYYIHCGILRRGMVKPRQAKISEALGLSLKTIRAANSELASYGLIRVAQQKAIVTEPGEHRRGPAKIVYLPMRQVTTAEANAEKSRLLALQKQRQADSYWNKVWAEFSALSQSWQGKEHTMGGFRSEIRVRLLAAGVPRHNVNIYFPTLPNP